MKKWLFIFLIQFVFSASFAQKNDIWCAFYNQDSTKIGFKDKLGKVKIEPKFVGISDNQKFDNIIAVMEESDGSWNSYYLTKSGKIVGKNNLYMFDNIQDCENEGFIRFTDQKTKLTGLFDIEGNIAIPAIYNSLTNVRNGILVSLEDATKKQDGEHYFYFGGKSNLINTQNKVLIENFIYEDIDKLNLFSLEISKTPTKDSIRKSFLAKDGSYYSFIDYEKEFKQWFEEILLKNLTSENLENNSFETIQHWGKWDYNTESSVWIKRKRKDFISTNFELLKTNLLVTKKPEIYSFISKNSLNPFIYNDEEYTIYFNNCNEAIDWKYPLMSIIINHVEGKILKQNSFSFLRTENGYKLVEVTLQTENLK